LYKELNKLSN